MQQEDFHDPKADGVGRLVADKYRLLRLLGKGGMGAVYAAENVWTRGNVAIKVLHAEVAGEADAVSRFLLEARATSSLRHPHIVEVYDMGREPQRGTLYIVQELLDGESLRAHLRGEGRLSPWAAVDVMGPILSALAAVHARGIVHRDLKPENIFLARGVGGAVVPKLIDFGISKLLRADAWDLAHRTHTGSLLGTPAYMSPEQARGDASLDARADIWSAGVVLYESLCGRRPFETDSIGLMISKVITEEVPRIESFAPELPRWLADAVHRALTRDRAARYPDAEAFRDALRVDAGPSARRLPRPVRWRVAVCAAVLSPVAFVVAVPVLVSLRLGGSERAVSASARTVGSSALDASVAPEPTAETTTDRATSDAALDRIRPPGPGGRTHPAPRSKSARASTPTRDAETSEDALPVAAAVADVTRTFAGTNGMDNL